MDLSVCAGESKRLCPALSDPAFFDGKGRYRPVSSIASPPRIKAAVRAMRMTVLGRVRAKSSPAPKEMKIKAKRFVCFM